MIKAILTTCRRAIETRFGAYPFVEIMKENKHQMPESQEKKPVRCRRT